jgi:hypothetical protein
MALLRLVPALGKAPAEALRAQEIVRDTIKGIARTIVEEAKVAEAAKSKVSGGKRDVISLLRM